MSSSRDLILIVGLQKSGTTLLTRLLTQTGLVDKPFKAEGDDFWGNVPQFSPTAFPAGDRYQLYEGKRGHELGEEDATPEAKSVMQQRFEALETDHSIILNKSPYNTVRLPWVRELFPDSTIVAMVRQPVANVFSLYKKFIPHDKSGLPPEEGWWGVRPEQWREMVMPDKLLQCAYQWQAVNAKLAQDRAYSDLIISYQQLCSNPTHWIETILSITSDKPITLESTIEPLQCFDMEYQKGSRLRSKNRYWRELKTLDIPDAEPIEIEPLTDDEVQKIDDICNPIAQKFEELHNPI
jgi:hypothetical protein